MSAGPERETEAFGGAQVRARRDALGWSCFLLHFAIMLYIAFGWIAPERAALMFYLVLLPAIAVQWSFNRNTCILNNLESAIRHGRWRDPGNPEEGAWLLTLARNALGLRATPLQMEVFTYAVLCALWGLGLAHLLR